MDKLHLQRHPTVYPLLLTEIKHCFIGKQNKPTVCFTQQQK